MSLQRESLGFAPAATQAFSFLVERLGFRLAKQEPTFVRYESKSVFVNIYHGRSSYEIGVEVGPRAQTPREAEEKFMLGDVLVACGESENLAFRRATTADEVSRYLFELAGLTGRFAVPALQGDPIFYQELRETQSRLAAKFLMSEQLKRARAIAEDALEEGDFGTVVRTLKPLARYLDEADRQKLLDAERRIR